MNSNPKFKFSHYFFVLIIITFTACAYYNTLFNALELYEEGTKKIANSKEGKITADIKKNFYSTIDKCWTLINIYSDSSKWADDALLLIGKSHYLIEEYRKSERFLDQFLKKYPQSDLIYEARIWYAKVLIELDEDEKALENLNNMLSGEMDSDLKAEALSSIGSIYYKRGDFREAIENLEQCVSISDDDILSASSQLLIGNIYFDLEKYVDAIENYNYVMDFDPLDEVEFNALMKKVDAQIALGKIDMALKTLNQMLRNSKLKDKYSLVEAKMGECFQLQNKIDFAAEHYLDVIEKYRRSLGSAQATYELAKLLEFHYVNADSSRKMYLKVKQESNRSEYVEEAGIRANLLKKYLDLRSKINKDYEILLAPIADSILVDTTISAFSDSISSVASIADSDSVHIKKDENIAEKHKEKIKNAKNSLAKNQYSLAEFFLLNMQNYDSAAAAYSKFIDTGYDSTKIPQTFHALSYLYSYKLQDSTKADSIDHIILERYPETPYAEYILVRSGKMKKEKIVVIDTLKNQYRNAEDYLFEDNYNTALNLFTEIAENDSGNPWGGKARYAISWIYENKLKDIPKAVESYTLLAKEYPKSDYAKIAKNKIKEPKVEIAVDTTHADTTHSDSSKVEDENMKDEEKEDTKLKENPENPEYENQRKSNEDEFIDEESVNPIKKQDDKSTQPETPSANCNFYYQHYSDLAQKGDTWNVFTV